MIGTQPTGAIDGVQISAVSHEGLSVSINGKPGRLAIISEDGQVIAAGKDVAREAQPWPLTATAISFRAKDSCAS